MEKVMLDPSTLASALRMIADGLDLLAGSASPTALSKATEVDPESAKRVAAKEAAKKAAAKEAAKEAEKAAAEAEKVEDEAAAPEESSEEGGKVTLQELQDQAAILLAGGHRRTLKTILDEVGVKSLSTAPESAYPDLKEKLAEAIEGIDLT